MGRRRAGSISRISFQSREFIISGALIPEFRTIRRARRSQIRSPNRTAHTSDRFYVWPNPNSPGYSPKPPLSDRPLTLTTPDLSKQNAISRCHADRPDKTCLTCIFSLSTYTHTCHVYFYTRARACVRVIIGYRLTLSRFTSPIPSPCYSSCSSRWRRQVIRLPHTDERCSQYSSTRAYPCQSKYLFDRLDYTHGHGRR